MFPSPDPPNVVKRGKQKRNKELPLKQCLETPAVKGIMLMAIFNLELVKVCFVADQYYQYYQLMQLTFCCNFYMKPSL